MQRMTKGTGHPIQLAKSIPTWVPCDARRYLAHTEGGVSIRELARKGGCAPSTVLRQVRRVEQKRDDPLIDEALDGLRVARRGVESGCATASPIDLFQARENCSMSQLPKQSELSDPSALDETTVAREAKRVLRRLSEQGACLAVAMDMEKAVVVRDLQTGAQCAPPFWIAGWRRQLRSRAGSRRR